MIIWAAVTILMIFGAGFAAGLNSGKRQGYLKGRTEYAAGLDRLKAKCDGEVK